MVVHAYCGTGYDNISIVADARQWGLMSLIFQIDPPHLHQFTGMYCVLISECGQSGAW
jgi:hypothetical protein